MLDRKKERITIKCFGILVSETGVLINPTQIEVYKSLVHCENDV